MTDAPLPAGTWRAWWHRNACVGDGDAVLRDLASRYAEPHRAYHDASHIVACLAGFARIRSLARDPEAVELAIWFHDAVYDPRASDNEQRSADLAVAMAAGAGLPAAFAWRVAALILATRHADAGSDLDEGVLLDVDLSILGEPPGVFDEYDRRIRREYDWVDDAAWRAGRAAVLRRFLERPRLYATAPYAASHEQQARDNLARALAVLAAPQGSPSP